MIGITPQARTFSTLIVFEMGPLIFSIFDINVSFKRPFKPLDNVTLTNSWKDLVNVCKCDL